MNSKTILKNVINLIICMIMVGCTNSLPAAIKMTPKSKTYFNHKTNAQSTESTLNFKGVQPFIKNILKKKIKNQNLANPQTRYREGLINLYESQNKTQNFSTKALSTAGTENIVNLNQTNLRKKPDSSIDEHGNGFIVWEDKRDGDEDVWGRKITNYALDGNDFRINQTTTNEQKEARVCLNNHGNGFIVWEDTRNSIANIWARKVTNYDLDGNEFIINQTNFGNRHNPELTIDNNGNGMIVWEQEYTVYNYGLNFYISYTSDIHARAILNYSFGGNEFIVNQFTSDEQSNPSISLNSSGNGLVVWEDTRNGEENIWAREINLFSTSGTDFMVNQNTFQAQTRPSISLNHSGNGLIVWEDNRSGNKDIWATQINQLSISGNEFIINQNLNEAQSTPSISLNSSGNGLVTWADNRSGDNDIWAREIKNSSVANQEFIIHQTTTNSQNEPTVDFNDSGRSVIVWEDKRNSDDIYTINIQNHGDEEDDPCEDDHPERPTTPTIIFDEDFSQASSEFGNDGDGSTDWTQWGGDYYPAGKGVVLWNPGPGQGIRDVPGEFIHTRPGLLESGIFRTIDINANTGDKLIAKMTVATTFSDTDSDVTVLLFFNDPDETIAISNTLKDTTTQEIVIESLIPTCATKVTVVALGYLGWDENSSFTFETLTLEQIPANYYNQSTLLDEPLDSMEDNQQGTNSPANIDNEFNYDLYVLDNYPIKYSGDKAVTVVKNGSTAPAGGMVKQINLNSYGAEDKLTAFLYTATTFTDPGSEAYLNLEFYDGDHHLLGQVISSKIHGNNYRWLSIDRATIPTGSTYVKLVPTVTLGNTETSSLLWDDLKLYLLQP